MNPATRAEDSPLPDMDMGAFPLANLKKSRDDRAANRRKVTNEGIGSPRGFSSDGLSPKSPYSPSAGSVTSTEQLRAMQFEKTKPCHFYKLGNCMKKDLCPFAHSQTEQRALPDLGKTKMCTKQLETGRCPKEDCTFAHSKEELRATELFLKTKMCKNYPNNSRDDQSGKCHLGSACRYAHSERELRRDMMMQSEQLALLELRSANENAVNVHPKTAARRQTSQNKKSKKKSKAAKQKGDVHTAQKHVAYYSTYDDTEVQAAPTLSLSEVLKVQQDDRYADSSAAQIFQRLVPGFDVGPKNGFVQTLGFPKSLPTHAYFPVDTDPVVTVPTASRLHRRSVSRAGRQRALRQLNLDEQVADWADVFSSPDQSPCSQISYGIASPLAGLRSPSFGSLLSRDSGVFRRAAIKSLHRTSLDPMLADGSPAVSRRKLSIGDSPMLSCGSPVSRRYRFSISSVSILSDVKPVQIAVTHHQQSGRVVEHASLVEVCESTAESNGRSLPMVVMNTFLHFRESSKVPAPSITKVRSKSVLY